MFIDSKSGKIVGDDGDNYDYTLFAPVAAALAENLPEQIIPSHVGPGHVVRPHVRGRPSSGARHRYG